MLNYSISVKLLIKLYLGFLSLTGGCTGSSESTLVKMTHCWKSRVTVQIQCIVLQVGYMAAQIVDEGETAVLRTGRIHKDYEGKSYIYALGRYLGGIAVQQGVTLILSIKASSEFLEMPIVTERFKHLFNMVRIDR